MSRITDFYCGTGTDQSGRTFDQALAFSNEEMEKCHDAVQWLFPLPEPSRFNVDAPLLTVEDMNAFSSQADLRWRAFQAIVRMARFYLDSDQWLTPGNHNFMRITRIIRFAVLISAEDMAVEFHALMFERAGTHPAVTPRTRRFWLEALDDDPPWAIPLAEMPS